MTISQVLYEKTDPYNLGVRYLTIRAPVAAVGF